MSRSLKGGSELLDLVPGPKEEVNLVIETFVTPDNSGLAEATNKYRPYYATNAVTLPKISEALVGNTLKVWECYRCDTGTMGGNTMMTIDVKGDPISWSGQQMNMWAVGGLPLEVVAILPPGEPPVDNSSFLPIAVNNATGKTYDCYTLTNASATLTKTGTFDCSIWEPNPFKNDNSKFFVKTVGTVNTPVVTGSNNSTSVMLLDDRGWGSICAQGKVYLTAVDIVGYGDPPSDKIPGWRYLTRFFRLYLRQRFIKSPYMLQDLYSSYVTQQVGDYTGQGGNAQVKEVTETFGRYGNTDPPDMTL